MRRRDLLKGFAGVAASLTAGMWDWEQHYNGMLRWIFPKEEPYTEIASTEKFNPEGQDDLQG